MRVYLITTLFAIIQQLTSRVGRTLRFKSRRLLCVNTHDTITTLILMKSYMLFCLIKLQQIHFTFSIINLTLFLFFQHFKVTRIYLVVMCCEYFKTVNFKIIIIYLKIKIPIKIFKML